MMPLRKASLAAIALTLAATCLFAIMDTTTNTLYRIKFILA